MALNPKTDMKVPAGLIILMIVQAMCAVFYVNDVVADFRDQATGSGMQFHLGTEAFATMSLVAAIAFEARYLRDLLCRKAHLEHNLRVASSAVHEVIAAVFESWKLSPSETDVATFLVKGLDIAEITRVRGCAEGTVKAHLGAIYRKSGTHSRGELLSVLIDDLLGGEAMNPVEPRSQRQAG